MAKTPKKSRRRLTEDEKIFIVQRLAMFDSVLEVVAALKEELGIDLSPQGVEHYDPAKNAGKSLAKKFVELFDKTRKAFLQHMEDQVPLANKSVRVRELSKAAQDMKRRGNYVGMASLLEQIAKECGNVHTNRRELTGKGGGPIQVSDMSDQELDMRLAAYIAGDSAKETQNDGRTD